MILAIREGELFSESMDSYTPYVVTEYPGSEEYYFPAGNVFYNLSHKLAKVIVVEKRDDYIIERYFIKNKSSNNYNKDTLFQLMVRLIPIGRNADEYSILKTSVLLDKKGIFNAYKYFNDYTGRSLALTNTTMYNTVKKLISYENIELLHMLKSWEYDAKHRHGLKLYPRDAINWNLRNTMNSSLCFQYVPFRTDVVVGDLLDMHAIIQDEGMSPNHIKNYVEDLFIPNTGSLFPHKLSEQLLSDGQININAFNQFKSVKYDPLMVCGEVRGREGTLLTNVESDWMEIFNALYYLPLTDVSYDETKESDIEKYKLGSRYQHFYLNGNIDPIIGKGKEICEFIKAKLKTIYGIDKSISFIKDFDQNLIVKLHTNGTPTETIQVDLVATTLVDHGLIFDKYNC